MDVHVLDCLIEGYESLIPTLKLRDRNDRHVLAAAIHGNISMFHDHHVQPSGFPEKNS